jgi:hypothetical protein
VLKNAHCILIRGSATTVSFSNNDLSLTMGGRNEVAVLCDYLDADSVCYLVPVLSRKPESGITFQPFSEVHPSGYGKVAGIFSRPASGVETLVTPFIGGIMKCDIRYLLAILFTVSMTKALAHDRLPSTSR